MVCVCVCVCVRLDREEENRSQIAPMFGHVTHLCVCVCVSGWVAGWVWVTDVVGVSLHACVSKRTIMHISGFTWEKYLSLAVAGRANMDILAFHILPVPEKHQVTVMHGCLA